MTLINASDLYEQDPDDKKTRLRTSKSLVDDSDLYETDVDDGKPRIRTTKGLTDEPTLYKELLTKTLLYVRDVQKTYNKIDPVKTSLVASTTKQIEFPGNSTEILLRHVTAGSTLWIGNNVDITVGGDGTFPIFEMESFIIDLKKGSELYGICSTNLDVYVLGQDKE